MSGMRVIYYSHTGNAARVAKAIAKARGAPIERITESKPRRGWQNKVDDFVTAVNALSI